MSQKKKMSSRSEQSVPTVRRSTLIVSVVMALLVGLYLGSLIPQLMGGQSATSGGGSGFVQGESLNNNDAEHMENARIAAEKNPKDADNWIHLGNLYFDAGKHAEAVLAYTKALEITPNNANVLTDRGTMYRLMGQFEQALDSYQRAQKADSRHEQSLFNMGIVLYYDLGRKAEARAAWEELVRKNPQATAPNGQKVQEMLGELF